MTKTEIKKFWKTANADEKQQLKKYADELYNNAVFENTFKQAETILLTIRELENRG